METAGEVHKREECVVEWTLRDYFSLPAKVDKPYFSPLFSFLGAEWRLAMYPEGQKQKGSEGHVDLYLSRQNSGPAIELKYTLGLKTADNVVAEETHYEWVFKEVFKGKGSIRFVKKAKLLDRKFEFVPSDRLTWVCRVKNPELADGESDDSVSECFTMSRLVDDFKQLSLSKENCDIVFEVQGREFHAHKAVLKIRSSVFASLFRKRIREKTTNFIEVEDCDSSTFSAFLRFLYCNDADVLSRENVLNLFAVAEKYHVTDLRAKCLEFVKETLSIDTLGGTFSTFHSENEPVQLAAA